MRILKLLLKAVLSFIVVFVVGGFVIADSWTVVRTITIRTSAEKIYPYVSNFKEWEKWSPWNATQDPTLHYDYSGSDAGIGATQTWTSKKMGNGTMHITAAAPDTGITYDLFMDMGYIHSEIHGNIAFASRNNITRITWTDQGQANGNYFKRWMNFLFRPTLAKNLETALAGLKKTAEETP